MARPKQNPHLETITINRSKINQAIGYAMALFHVAISGRKQSMDKAIEVFSLSEIEAVILRQEMDEIEPAKQQQVYQHIVDGHDTLAPDDVSLGVPDDFEAVIAPDLSAPKNKTTAKKSA